MPSLNLRDVPDELMRKIRIKAATDGTGIRALAIGILEARLKEGENYGRESLPVDVKVVAASTKTRKAKVLASSVKALEFAGQGGGEPSSEPRTVGERTEMPQSDASKQTSTPSELSPEVKMKPPEGSSWSRIGWITMVDKLRREPTEAEWPLYQKNKL